MDEHTRQTAKALIIQHEGFRSWPYRDTRGFLTVGYGHCLDTNSISINASSVILDDDMQCIIAALNKYVSYFSSLAPARQVALIDMAFNLGITGILKFDDMWNCLLAGDWAGASKAMLKSKWAKEVGKRAEDDANLMLTGQFPNKS